MTQDSIPSGNIAKYLRAYLDFHGKKQVELTDVINKQKAGISKIVNCERGLKAEDAMKIWSWLGYKDDQWRRLYVEPPKSMEAIYPVNAAPIEVRGDVEAGVWREAMEWPPFDRYKITVPVDSSYGNIPRYGLLVRGDSMNKVFPDGTVVIVINYADLGRGPRTGDYAVALRRSRCGSEFEATVKAVQVSENGDMILWPQSFSPDFKPVILHADRSGDYGNGMDGHSNGAPDVQILAVVVGAYQSIPRASF